jgi:hypothetical protein
MSEETALKEIEEDGKEFFVIRNASVQGPKHICRYQTALTMTISIPHHYTVIDTAPLPVEATLDVRCAFPVFSVRILCLVPSVENQLVIDSLLYHES